MKRSKKNPTPNDTTELDNFTELTRKLLQVSKKEIDDECDKDTNNKTNSFKTKSLKNLTK